MSEGFDQGEVGPEILGFHFSAAEDVGIFSDAGEAVLIPGSEAGSDLLPLEDLKGVEGSEDPSEDESRFGLFSEADDSGSTLSVGPILADYFMSDIR